MAVVLRVSLNSHVMLFIYLIWLVTFQKDVNSSSLVRDANLALSLFVSLSYATLHMIICTAFPSQRECILNIAHGQPVAEVPEYQHVLVSLISCIVVCSIPALL